jgi:hypothetical protein
MNTLHELAHLVYRTRAAQRAYFAKRIPARLIAAKVLECELDQVLDELRGQTMIKWPQYVPADEVPADAVTFTG